VGSQLLPLKNPKPDARHFIDVMMGKAKSSRPPLIDLKASQAVMKPVVTDLLGRDWVDDELLSFPALTNAIAPPEMDRRLQRVAWDSFIAFWYFLGYDVVRIEAGMRFPRFAPSAADSTMPDGRREWADLSTGVIVDWASFESYPWPRVEDVDFSLLEYVSKHLPDGMGILVSHAGGVFEHLSQMLSLEKLWYLLYDDPDLVRAVSDRVGALMEAFYRQVVDFPEVVAIFPGDDMGFRSGTLVSPQHLRQLALPWHARYARLARENDLCFFLHSCGNVYELMPDLLEDVKIDGKHSFEDTILPVESFLGRYGERVAALGGLDVDFLCGSTVQAVRDYVRKKIELCAPYGRFAIGTGSSIASYMPPENYLAMIETVLES